MAKTVPGVATPLLGSSAPRRNGDFNLGFQREKHGDTQRGLAISAAGFTGVAYGRTWRRTLRSGAAAAALRQ